jgi:hypothetical protein
VAPINPESVLIIAGALSVAIATMFISMKAVSHVYDPLTAPLATVTVTGDRQVSIPYYHGLWSLYAAFFVCGMIFAFTGGTIGMSVDEWTPATTRYHLVWGFSAGILVAALARISAVYLSTGLARSVQLLTVASLGVLAFKLVHNPGFITILIDQFVRPGGGRYFPVFAILAAGISIGAVELGICLCRRAPSANSVPYSLLRERVEEYTEVQQVFWPADVVAYTEDTLARIITREGLTELCWLTNTGPTTHLPRVLDALKERLRQEPSATGNEEVLAQTIIRAATRIIVTTDEAMQSLTRLEYVSRILHLPEPLRVRVIVINGRHAILHLPIPFEGAENEQSNCAMLISSPELVEPLREAFDTIWENKYHAETLETLLQYVIRGEQALLMVIKIVYGSHRPLTVDELVSEFNNRWNQTASEADVRSYVDALARERLLRFVDKERISASRYTRMCRTADVLRRLRL